MKRVQKWFGDIELSKDLVLLLAIGGLYSLSVSLSNSFVNIYLWKQTGEYIDLAVYNLSVVILQPLTFIVAGRWAKKVDRVLVFRIGVAFLALFYLCVLFSRGHASQYIVLLGGLLGVGYGFYWLAYNVLTFEITEPETRDFFNGFMGAFSSIGGMAGPFAAGLIISAIGKNGYTVVFALSLLLFAIAVVLSFFISPRPAQGRYLFKHVLKQRSYNPNWKRITNAHFVQGLRDGTFVFMISVFVFLSTGSELSLGTFGLINSFLQFLGYTLVARFVKIKHRQRLIFLGGLLLYAAVFLFIFEVTYPRMLLYAATIALAYPLLLVPYNSMTYDVIGRAWKAAEARIEYIVVLEMFTNSGRITSILLFIVAVTFFNDQVSIRVLMLLIGAGHLCISFFTRNIRLREDL
ncbi:MFS transporter [Weizmannia acidilactici]|uniref:MFS transporter n=1 Tax=Weizmannia acidilactici TaxID=2607726 RepID=A0A5J4JGE6_9BACI|nr:MFS transporter [Weizmannia acidilactici]GER66907.1 MFS transporter [Weizmannia acidilactici]GER69560.1 MFS transporter [Weizmannia acidilactici]GER72763.1 MFS transporter [Weizmannia acidilactici]